MSLLTATHSALLDSAALERALADAEPVASTLRALLAQHDASLRQGFEANLPVTQLVRARAAFIDRVLLRVWQTQASPLPASAGLIAVGGYGRGELHPGSDIDLLILLEGAPAEPARRAIEQFTQLLWDTGLALAHSVRTVEQCAHEAARDVTIMTSLMEARLLTGPPALFDDLRSAIATHAIWPTPEFFQAKYDEQRRRHHKYHDTAYNLEPNIKEGPGGLRDIQTISWITLRHFGSNHLHDLVTHGFLTESEHTLLREGREFLWRIRFALHLLTGRCEDRLLFDYQGTLATQFGYHDEGHRLAVEQLMKRYYLAAMELGRLNEMLLQHFQESLLYAATHSAEIRPINKRFHLRNDVIEVVHPDVFRRYPFALLEIFLLLAQQPKLKGVRASTIRLIRDHRYLIDQAFRADLRCRMLFMELLRQPQGIMRELRRMHRYGVLGAYIPSFGAVEGQMQYDLFHVYTVDEHTLFLLRNLRRFSLPEFSQEFPLCSEIFQRLPKPEILYLAGLFHDIAKGRGGDHSTLGAEDALGFCLHHGMSAHDARIVAWLVRHHLVLSRTAQREDIQDPEVIAHFASAVCDNTHLDYLYLLTVADIRATNSTLWNSWKGALLSELYLATAALLRRGLGAPIDQTERIRTTQAEARALLHAESVDDHAITLFWDALDDDYFLRHEADEIVWHTAAVVGATAGNQPLVRIRHSAQRGTELFIYTRDQKNLFALTTAALDQMALSIVGARIVTAHTGYTLDTFHILEESGESALTPQRMHEIVTFLEHTLAQGETGPVTRRVRRHVRHFKVPTQITFTDDTRNRRTVLEVISADRPGLLSAIGHALMAAGVQLQNAKIATLGARAEDIFFITDAHNQPLSPEQQWQLQQALLHSIDQPLKNQA
ncbi:MAG: [protein-PII] uridylyltransferase [Gammaproteobacteria bacterium]|nr:[protein-PII] uridylyltransferase [Gammaproteobacteria bacterium]